MTAIIPTPNQPASPESARSNPYARAIQASRKARWDIERDVIRGRTLELTHDYLPASLSLVESLDFLTASERRLMSQIQGRSYANIFGLVERFINAKVLEMGQRYYFGDQLALEALVRFSDEELKHQELFRRVEQLAAQGMPAGYQFKPDPNEVAQVVLQKSTWAVLGLTCHIELFTLAHYRSSIDSDAQLSPLWRDVFLYHWKEESQHAYLDELEWRREDARLGPEERDRAVDDLIALVVAVDGVLQVQASADATYFMNVMGRELMAAQRLAVEAQVLRAYRYQYILSGLEMTRFPEVLFGFVTDAQRARISAALATLT